MALWQLTAKRSSGFRIELGVYGFSELDLTDEIRETVGKVTVKNMQPTNFDIVEIEFKKVKPRRCTPKRR